MKDKTMEKKNHNITFADIVIIAILQTTFIQRTAEVHPRTLVEVDIPVTIKFILIRKVQVKHLFVFIQLRR